jgi:hypothetical protein
MINSGAIGTAQSTRIAKASMDQLATSTKMGTSRVRWLGGNVGGVRTGGDVVEGDAGAGEGVLHVVGDAAGVPVSGDGDGAGVAGGGEGGAHVLGDAVRVAAAGDVAVLDVPPDRGLRDRVLPHRRRRPPAPVSQAERPRVLGAWVFYWYRRRRRREGRGGGRYLSV